MTFTRMTTMFSNSRWSWLSIRALSIRALYDVAVGRVVWVDCSRSSDILPLGLWSLFRIHVDVVNNLKYRVSYTGCVCRDAACLFAFDTPITNRRFEVPIQSTLLAMAHLRLRRCVWFPVLGGFSKG